MATDGRSIDKALGTHIVIDSGNIPDDVVIQSDIGPGSVGTTELEDLGVTNGKLAAATIQGTKIDVFKSTEITADGSEQDTAHGLVHTPTSVIVTMTENDGTAVDLVQGTHDATNVKVTANDAAVKYTIVAF